MKKSSKSAKSRAPATKAKVVKNVKAKPAAAARRTAKAAPSVKARARPARRPASRQANASQTSVVPAPTAAPAVVTSITAVIDIGFGNTLHIRGEGAGLSWDRGLPMECVTDNQWRILLGESGRPFAFKFLVNDLSWSAGPDYVVEAGSAVTLEPSF
jgi:hypothetical protein